jgi:hypothetical protein
MPRQIFENREISVWIAALVLPRAKKIGLENYKVVYAEHGIISAKNI